jgi:hypothetical protein
MRQSGQLPDMDIILAGSHRGRLRFQKQNLHLPLNGSSVTLSTMPLPELFVPVGQQFSIFPKHIACEIPPAIEIDKRRFHNPSVSLDQASRQRITIQRHLSAR